jgi:UDP:flavonoid glycosyltransferase YjiC (YdhE family)
VRVLAACSLGGAGHLRPLVPFLDVARRRGSQTLVIGPPALEGLVAATGHPFLAGGEPPESQVRPIREQLAVAPAEEASVLGNRELFGRLATIPMLAPMDGAIRNWRPDVILRDPCEYASAVVAAELGLAAFQVAISLADVEWGSLAVAAPALEEHRAGLTGTLRGSPYLTRFPAALDASPFPGTVRYREPPAEPGGRLPGGWDSAHASAPLVYVTLGTVLGRMSFAEQSYRAVIDAVTGLDARVLVTTGRGFDPARLGDVPGNVRVAAWVDQGDVLREASLVVCHGGSGTTFGALAAGVPVVVIPAFADQFANAARVVQAGAGIHVRVDGSADTVAGESRAPFGRADAPRIRQAIDTVMADNPYRDRARAIAAEMSAAPEVSALLARMARPGHPWAGLPGANWPGSGAEPLTVTVTAALCQTRPSSSPRVRRWRAS